MNARLHHHPLPRRFTQSGTSAEVHAYTQARTNVCASTPPQRPKQSNPFIPVHPSTHAPPDPSVNEEVAQHGLALVSLSGLGAENIIGFIISIPRRFALAASLFRCCKPNFGGAPYLSGERSCRGHVNYCRVRVDTIWVESGWLVGGQGRGGSRFGVGRYEKLMSSHLWQIISAAASSASTKNLAISPDIGALAT